jgi:KUP system potassium uptake protein
MVHRQADSKGQIYIPSVNTLLWIGCVLMMVYFKEKFTYGAVYFSITVTMMMTTILLSYFIYYKLKWNKIYVILI